MKRRDFVQTAGLAGLGGVLAGACGKTRTAAAPKKLFSFVFFTDVHVQPESGGKEGFLAAIEKMNSLKPDFALGGGDYVMDALGADEKRAVELYDLYAECAKTFAMPVHLVMGNHEVFGPYVPDKVPVNHPEWGKEMFKKRLGGGATYRSFDHKGVHFVLLDSVGLVKHTDKPGFRYIGEIGGEQLAWLKSDLAKLSPDTPVIGASHIPIFSFYTQIFNGFTTPTPASEVITDAKPLFETLMARRLFGYLEGHMHINERYEYMGSPFIDTGAVSAGWWGGPFNGHPEGFNHVTVWEDRITTEYVTYGWDATKYKPQTKNAELFPRWAGWDKDGHRGV